MRSRLYLPGIIKLYCEKEHYIHEISMFKSGCTSSMLRKYNGVAAIKKLEIYNLFKQHCYGHRENLAVEDAWKNVPLMIQIRICKTNKEKFQELAKTAECNAIAFRLLYEVRWYSRHLAVTSWKRNCKIQINYFN
ncbi:hypothetical protein RF11_09521 [Thelohanellus kitauei]|uniref:Uncharacterized protein n=1 Tax=Thelohanellus kitauei TaxID=669202 RepID=A0A0C2JL61_THEKT|nr:hypothetical protein RF11_09521 [Thelohanellus kitauei]